MRHPCDKALAALRATMSTGHVGLGPGLVDKDEARCGNAVLMASPPLALGGDVGPILLSGVQTFF